MTSTLRAILDRLDAMTKSDDGEEEQVRRFEKNGELKAEVTYDVNNATFSLKYIDNNEVGEFDNIDVVAMEIYDLIY